VLLLRASKPDLVAGNRGLSCDVVPDKLFRMNLNNHGCTRSSPMVASRGAPCRDARCAEPATHEPNRYLRRLVVLARRQCP